MITEDKRAVFKEEDRNIEQEIIRFLSPVLRNVIKKLDGKRLKSLEEIRLRANKPLAVHSCGKDSFVEVSGKLAESFINEPFIVTQEEILKTLELMSENSIYAYQDEIKNGFLTLRGGHRVGIAGKVVMEGANIRYIKDVSGLNIRVSREVQGCALGIVKHLIKNRSEIYNTLILSPPQCGKTTMLRDITRILSTGMEEFSLKGMKIGVVDERSEIAACYKGIPQNNVGARTDVLDGCPKTLGMEMLLRSMSPQVIVTDEIGNQGDKDAVMKVINAGVKIITTAHGYNISELKTRQEVLSLMESKIFERYVVLTNSHGPGTVEEIIDGVNMAPLLKRRRD